MFNFCLFFLRNISAASLISCRCVRRVFRIGLVERAMYDVAVVGAGLIGSATAKHLAKKGLKVDT